MGSTAKEGITIIPTLSGREESRAFEACLGPCSQLPPTLFSPVAGVCGVRPSPNLSFPKTHSRSWERSEAHGVSQFEFHMVFRGPFYPGHPLLLSSLSCCNPITRASPVVIKNIPSGRRAPFQPPLEQMSHVSSICFLTSLKMEGAHRVFPSGRG